MHAGIAMYALVAKNQNDGNTYLLRGTYFALL